MQALGAREGLLAKREALVAEREALVAKREVLVREQSLLLSAPPLPMRPTAAADAIAAPSFSLPPLCSDPTWIARLRVEVSSAASERAWILKFITAVRGWLRLRDEVSQRTAALVGTIRLQPSTLVHSGVFARCAQHFDGISAASRATIADVEARVLAPLAALAAGVYSDVERHATQLSRMEKALERARVKYLSNSTSSSSSVGSSLGSGSSSGGGPTTPEGYVVPPGSEVMARPSSSGSGSGNSRRHHGRRPSTLESTALRVAAIGGRIAETRRPGLEREAEASRRAYERERLAVVEALHAVGFAQRSALVTSAAALEHLIVVAQHQRAAAVPPLHETERMRSQVAAQSRVVVVQCAQRSEAFAARRESLLEAACATTVRVAPLDSTSDTDLVHGEVEVIAGWLRKQGSNLVKSWKTRWFYILGGALFYQRGGKGDDLEPVHVVDILLCNVKESDAGSLPHTVRRIMCCYEVLRTTVLIESIKLTVNHSIPCDYSATLYCTS